MRWRPGLCPRPHWGSLQHSQAPKLLLWIEGKRRGETKGRKGEWDEEGKEKGRNENVARGGPHQVWKQIDDYA